MITNEHDQERNYVSSKANPLICHFKRNIVFV